MSRYFKYFPTVSHNGNTLADITKRTKFREENFGNPYLFLPYTIEGDDRPEQVSYYYYDDVAYVWLVYLANNIIDPYSQWPLSQEDLNSHIIKKYKSQSGVTGNAVIDWTKNTTITDNIMHYENLADPEKRISKDTYDLNSEIIGGEWRAVRYYDYETSLNDDKRTIQLVNKAYAKQLEYKLRALMVE